MEKDPNALVLQEIMDLMDDQMLLLCVSTEKAS